MDTYRKLLRALVYPVAWPVLGMPGRSHRGPMTALDATESAVKQQVEAVVRKLADEIGERHARNYKGLVAAEQYIASELTALGYSVTFQSFTYAGVQMKNVIAERRGVSKPNEIVVVGAHYDTVYGTPGADDNASGVAALLAIARLIRDVKHSRTIRLVAFANEENQNNPVWSDMGSYVYARSCKESGDNIVGMMSLEMLGVYSDAPNSQHYPKPFNWFFPSVGNFVGFVGNLRSRRFVRECVAAFRAQCRFPSEGAAVPERFRDIARSDHWSFWQFGYQAVMITDTSNFRNRLYHTKDDKPEILDFDRLARLTVGLSKMIVTLAR